MRRIEHVLVGYNTILFDFNIQDAINAVLTSIIFTNGSVLNWFVTL